MDQELPPGVVVVDEPELRRMLQQMADQAKTDHEVREQLVWLQQHLLHDEQKAITFGDHWVSFMGYQSPEPEARRLVFGEVVDLDWYRRAQYGQGVDTAIIEAHVAEFKRRMGAHLLSGFSYSVYIPEGEAHDPFALAVWPLQASLFEQASDAGWDEDRFPQELRAHLGIIGYAWLTHRRRIDAESARIEKAYHEGRAI